MSKKLRNLLEDKIVVKRFVAHLAANGEIGLEIDRIPDLENRNTKAIDAVAGKFAIEHTSIDTIPDQREKDAWFMTVVGDIEKEFRTSFAYWLSIVLPYGAVRTKQNWSEIKSSVRDWIVNESPLLPDGSHKVEGIAGVPFYLMVHKASDSLRGVSFSRMIPDDNTLHVRIKEKIDEKLKKLEPYKLNKKITVLLIESFDTALMTKSKMIEAVRVAFPAGVPIVDQLWFADTSIPENIQFCDFTNQVRAKVS